jgi:hypothetical protein
MKKIEASKVKTHINFQISHCELIRTIKLSGATFVAQYTVAPHLEFTTIRSSFRLKQPRIVAVRSYKVRKK